MDFEFKKRVELPSIHEVCESSPAGAFICSYVMNLILVFAVNLELSDVVNIARIDITGVSHAIPCVFISLLVSLFLAPRFKRRHLFRSPDHLITCLKGKFNRPWQILRFVGKFETRREMYTETLSDPGG